ncbi:facilitated trehalose transporter Tret1-like [Macrosteles quadrilineatus]|uniref:facilitated trehalose transporter Tret1-like n=1 Tax=Macrosteles quadrilineatus TaxID=74068 RepID=UPI0023E21809|nr:facilitated trehalose transporter Tret1-like [Macrosteles quadrilineatus]
MKGAVPSTDLPTTGALRQYVAACSASLMVMTTGCWLGWPSPAIPKLEHNETSVIVNSNQISWMVALMDAGSAVSPVPAGFLMDIIGRKVVLLLAGLLFALSWLMALLAHTPSVLYVARFLAGAGKGVAFTVAPMYLGEIASTGIRGAVSTMFAGLLWAGTMFEFGIGPMVGYDSLIMMSLSVPVLFLATFIFMPESPYYLVMKGRDKDAKKALQWLRNSPDQPEENAATNPVNVELKLIQNTVNEEMQDKSSFVDLVSSYSNKRATTIVVIISMFQRTCGISPLLAYSSTTLPKTDSFIGPSQIIVVFGLILTISNFLATPLVDRLGRKPLLIFSGAGCGVATGVSSLFYYLQDNTTVDVSGYVWVPYVCICVFGLTHSIGIGVIPHTLLAELYPQNVKCYAAAVAAITFALSSFAINKVYASVTHEVGVFAMFAFFSLNGLVCALFSYFVIFETKGKTFAEIQSVLKKER